MLRRQRDLKKICLLEANGNNCAALMKTSISTESLDVSGERRMCVRVHLCGPKSVCYQNNEEILRTF